MHPEHRTIGELAYRIWQDRGCPQGSAEQDWLDAEKQLRLAPRAAEPRTAGSSPPQHSKSAPDTPSAKRPG